MVAAVGHAEALASLEMTALYSCHHAGVHAFCLSRLRDKEDAEDATQSTFLYAYSALRRGVVPRHESAWLFTIAQNVCRMRRRSVVRRKRIETPADLDLISEVVPARPRDHDELFDLRRALRDLPERRREVLLLREWRGFSYKEIAEELGITQASVETLLFRARRSLAESLNPQEEKRERRGFCPSISERSRPLSAACSAAAW